MLSLTQSILIEASLDNVYQTIIDFEKYPHIFTAVKKAKIIKKNKKTPRVSFSLNILRQVNCILDFHLAPDHIKWKLVEGDMMKRNEGSWTLEEMGKNEVDVTYQLNVDLAVWMPTLVAEPLMKSNALGMLKQLKLYVER